MKTREFNFNHNWFDVIILVTILAIIRFIMKLIFPSLSHTVSPVVYIIFFFLVEFWYWSYFSFRVILNDDSIHVDYKGLILGAVWRIKHDEILDIKLSERSPLFRWLLFAIHWGSSDYIWSKGKYKITILSTNSTKKLVFMVPDKKVAEEICAALSMTPISTPALLS